MNGVARFIARRLAFGVVLVAGVSAIVFFLVNAIGNPIAMLVAGQPNATEDQIAGAQKDLAAAQTALQAAKDDLANKIESLQVDQTL